MATIENQVLFARIGNVPFVVTHVYDTKKSFNGRSHLLASDLGGKTFSDKIYFKLTDFEARKYAKKMLEEAVTYVKKKKMVVRRR